MAIRRTVSMFDLKTSSEEVHLKCQATQSGLSMLRPNVLRFVLTPFTAKERCRLVQNQLDQLQYEHSQLLSHTGRQTESNNTLPAERANESTQVCKPGPEGIDKEEQPETGYKSKTAQKRYKEMESDLDNLLRDLEKEAAKIRYKEMESNLDNLMRDLERELTSMNSKVEKENLQLKAEQHIHSKTTFQIQSHCDMNKSSFETGRELRENVAEVKNLVKRVQEENDLSAGYTSRKKAKLSFFQRLRRWANNLNCFRSHGHDEEQENTSII